MDIKEKTKKSLAVAILIGGLLFLIGAFSGIIKTIPKKQISEEPSYYCDQITGTSDENPVDDIPLIEKPPVIEENVNNIPPIEQPLPTQDNPQK